jgi:hypothetical protein
MFSQEPEQSRCAQRQGTLFFYSRVEIEALQKHGIRENGTQGGQCKTARWAGRRVSMDGHSGWWRGPALRRSRLFFPFVVGIAIDSTGTAILLNADVTVEHSEDSRHGFAGWE